MKYFTAAFAHPPNESTTLVIWSISNWRKLLAEEELEAETAADDTLAAKEDDTLETEESADEDDEEAPPPTIPTGWIFVKSSESTYFFIAWQSGDLYESRRSYLQPRLQKVSSVDFVSMSGSF